MSLRVLFATPECAPWLKTGGLGEVAAALPQALRALSLDVRTLLPAYPPVLAAAAGARECARFEPLAQLPAARLLEATLPSGVAALLVECAPLYERAGGAYLDERGRDWEDNWLRFGQLGRIAASLAGERSPLSWRPQVLHCNDWQTGLAPAYLHFSGGWRARTLMCVHNVSFQGLFPRECLEPLGLPPQAYALSGLEFFGRLSFLKAGLQYADAICTVSPTYAREIQEKSFGCGLEGLFAQRRDVLHGILNGIDDRIWDPRSDPAVASPYDAGSLERKAASKAALQRRFGLQASPRTLLFGAVSRLTQQKGIDLIVEAAPELLALPCQLAILGTGEPRLERRLAQLGHANPGRIGVRIAFDEDDAHLVQAGADAFLMPSRFEPCGLNQMYSQRYGTPPVARATGGLLDTIEDGRSGFLFDRPEAAALLEAARRAHAAYLAPRRWRELQRHGMAKDFGWQASARAYAALYDGLVKAIS